MADDRLPSFTAPTVTREINGREYVVTRAPWSVCMDVWHLLVGILGQDLAHVLEPGATMGDVASGLANVPAGAALQAIAGALLRATGPDGRKVLALLGHQTRVSHEGARPVLDKAQADQWFCMFPADMIPWMMLCLEVQVRDFLGPLTSLLAGKPEAGQADQSQST